MLFLMFLLVGLSLTFLLKKKREFLPVLRENCPRDSVYIVDLTGILEDIFSKPKMFFILLNQDHLQEPAFQYSFFSQFIL